MRERRRQYRGALRALLLAASTVVASTAAVAIAGAARAPSELMAALQARGDARRGAALYETCAACHGADGGGVSDGTVPAIAGQPVEVLAKQLADFRRDQRSDLRMEHFADARHLSGAQEIADVAAYVNTLVSSRPPGRGDGAALARGAELYRRGCESCHGEAGRGNGPRMLPWVAGQHAAYTLRQLTEAAAGRRPGGGRAAAGRRPGMQPSHRGLLGGLTAGDLAALADHLSRMERAPGSAR